MTSTLPPMTPEKPMDPVTTFASFLADQRRGRLHADATEALAECTAAVLATGKNGTVTITLKIERTAEDQVDISDDLTLKLPKPARGKTVWYADETTGRLTRNPIGQSTIEDQIAERRLDREARA